LITALAVIGAPTLVVKWISRIWEAAMRTSELKRTLEAAIRLQRSTEPKGIQASS
jgi:hypothetical protein